VSDISNKALRRAANQIIKEHSWREDAIAMRDGLGEWLRGNDGNVRSCFILLEATTPAHEFSLETLAVEVISMIAMVRDVEPAEIFKDIIELHFSPAQWDERVEHTFRNFDIDAAIKINRELNESYQPQEGPG